VSNSTDATITPKFFTVHQLYISGAYIMHLCL